MSYQVLIERAAQKQLARLPRDQRERTASAIRALGDDPRPHGSKKLKDRDGWRIRVGEYRVIYRIQDERLIVLVIVIGHRRDVYRL